MEQSERTNLRQFKFTEVKLKWIGIVPPLHLLNLSLLNISRYLTQYSTIPDYITHSAPRRWEIMTTLIRFSGFVVQFPGSALKLTL
jgi:hypothetical protein